MLGVKSSLCTNESTFLYNNQFIYSPNQAYAAGINNNYFGVYNVSVSGSVGSALWTASQSSAPSGDYLSPQTDRNLVVYNSGGGAIWASNTQNSGAGSPFCLTMENNGNLVWYDNSFTTVWQTNTVQGR
ncbi:unnamed protein product [Didymodactylos carnosus]|uniref:Bulb-type lectin domain-containing protein n=1 Tax=Didymodactylos carnosus TaxID=1234261 RepID=A0A815U7Q3_9BILA|nr:unnamed protein product [Didymodactylos carnosus]CAF4375745.1 unnamed protein product [Didymodactylos carnosus]